MRDKVAIITGAASGIGLASVIKFAQEGAKIVAVDINEAQNHDAVEALKADGGAAVSVQGDVSDPETARVMIKAAVDTYGRLDILFNNAGIGARGNVLDVDEQSFDRVFAVNVKAIYLASREAVPVMKSNRGGVILNTASQLGMVGLRNNAAYCASKGAVIQLTRCMALDHATDGIRVNCVCPGPTDTPTIRRGRENVDSYLSGLADRVPLARMGTTEEIANVSAFLCSDEASFMTGAAIVADGGWSAQ